jgi:hypothetical protein
MTCLWLRDVLLSQHVASLRAVLEEPARKYQALLRNVGVLWVRRGERCLDVANRALEGNAQMERRLGHGGCLDDEVDAGHGCGGVYTASSHAWGALARLRPASAGGWKRAVLLEEASWQGRSVSLFRAFTLVLHFLFSLFRALANCCTPHATAGPGVEIHATAGHTHTLAL